MTSPGSPAARDVGPSELRLHVFYRDFNPVLHASLALDFWIGGGSSTVFHITSLTIHVLNAALAVCPAEPTRCGAAAGLAGQRGVGGSSASGRAAIWTAARGHSLATLFCLLALIALTSPRRSSLPLALLAFTLALLSKEVA